MAVFIFIALLHKKIKIFDLKISYLEILFYIRDGVYHSSDRINNTFPK